MELNKESLAKAKEMETPEEILAFAKENGMEMTDESAKAYFEIIHPKAGELADAELDKVSGGKFDEMGGMGSIPGLTCPHCGKFIPKTITELLTQGHLRCPYCLSVLNLDPEKA